MKHTSVTKIIEQRIEEIFNAFADKEIQNVIYGQDKDDVMKFFVKYFTEAPCFGDYIRLYIYETTDLKNSGMAYDEIDDNVYYKDYISKSFSERLGKVRASLNPNSKETLGTKKDILSGERKPTREDVFLFAFGLGMDVDTVSLILKKCLLQTDFNVKNYKEVIYYWCLKNDLPYHVMLEWLSYYEQLDPDAESMRKRTTAIDKTNTLVLTDKVMSRFMDDDDVRAYLLSLKKAGKEDLIRKSEKQYLKELVRGFPKALVKPGDVFLEKDKTGMSKKQILEEDRSYSQSVDPEKRVRILNEIRIRSFEKNKEALLPEEILTLLFGSLSYTEKMLSKRFYEATPVSREEILAGEFIVYMAGILDEEMENETVTFQKRKADWEDFAEMVSESLEDLGMERFYERNPFDLFLVFCMMHQDPFGYFMASWEKGRKKNG